MRIRLVLAVLALMGISFPALAIDTFMPGDGCLVLGATHMAADNTGLVICALNTGVVSSTVTCETPAGGGCTWKSMTAPNVVDPPWPEKFICHLTPGTYEGLGNNQDNVANYGGREWGTNRRIYNVNNSRDGNVLIWVGPDYRITIGPGSFGSFGECAVGKDIRTFPTTLNPL